MRTPMTEIIFSLLRTEFQENVCFIHKFIARPMLVGTLMEMEVFTTSLLSLSPSLTELTAIHPVDDEHWHNGRRCSAKIWEVWSGSRPRRSPPTQQPGGLYQLTADKAVYISPYFWTGYILLNHKVYPYVQSEPTNSLFTGCGLTHIVWLHSW